MPWNMDIFAIGGSEERGYVMYDVEFDDIYIYIYETLFYFYIYR